MSPPTIATALAPLLHAVLGEDLPLQVRFWDGSRMGHPEAPATIVLPMTRAPA